MSRQRSIVVAAILGAALPAHADHVQSPLGFTVWGDRGYPDRDATIAGLDLGLFDSFHREADGVQIAVGFNIDGEQAGLQLAGLGNWTSNHARGSVQLAGLFNVVDKADLVFQIAGGLNAAGSGRVVQLGTFNLTIDDSYGVQLGLFNVAIGNHTGVQIGGFNGATHVTGVQIGLYNFAKTLEGVQLGVINIARNNAAPFTVLLNIGW